MLWTSFGVFLALRGIGPRLPPNKTNGSVVPIGLNRLVIPGLIVCRTHTSAVKEIATADAGDVEPRLLENHVHKKFITCCIALHARGFYAAYNTKISLNIPGDGAVHMHVVDQRRSVFQFVVKVKDGAVDLYRGVFILPQETKSSLPVQLLQVLRSNAFLPTVDGRKAVKRDIQPGVFVDQHKIRHGLELGVLQNTNAVHVRVFKEKDGEFAIDVEGRIVAAFLGDVQRPCGFKRKMLTDHTIDDRTVEKGLGNLGINHRNRLAINHRCPQTAVAASVKNLAGEDTGHNRFVFPKLG